ncbi:hypothetical protein [Riemerella columbipharyngis]|uniref:Uncharacterized protein n=1 Tax=Riemerella columbipharyngis TaxID=1071918 RepID=A0A1G7FBP6_9FLAO|nr:hypothetical protein [Riemerella columbipharyngis]SDE73409.1 hypothetical protein SAMN05421544_12130 [Riemerella columbipharyngis]
MNLEIFPPTEQELEEMIYNLTRKLEDERYRDEWEEIAEALEEKEQQLKEITIKNNTI